MSAVGVATSAFGEHRWSLLTTFMVSKPHHFMKRLHYVAGLTLAVFVSFHLLNHLSPLYGPEQHIATMPTLRSLYRNPVAETLLLGAVGVQMVSGWWLFTQRK